ncbi:MAG TPA: AAA-like domain-containing protein [Stenomitos sp.]
MFADASPFQPIAFQVGGSLKSNDPLYVERQSDQELYAKLVAGELCYVFNARQMGKSSLRLRVKQKLQQAGVCCPSIDMSRIGSDTLTPWQWYKGIAVDLLRGLNLLGRVPFKAWWQEQEGLSPVLSLHHLIEDILLQEIAGPIVICIDEIDSVIGLPFSTDDFFAFIRFCYNQRPENPAYQRLTFALFGVATPADLIADPSHTPFNVGHAIPLSGFQLAEAEPLIRSLRGWVADPEAAMAEILQWTGGQPFLTQKLCRLLAEHAATTAPIATPAEFIGNLVRSRLIDHWESQDDPEHLRTIRDRLLCDPQRQGRLLGLYRSILTQGSIAANDSPEQRAFLLTGLVTNRNGHLHPANAIYQAVFNLAWVDAQLSALRPYAVALEQWCASEEQDTSRLLHGQALQEALTWAADKQLSDLDYHYLGASQDSDRRLETQRLEAARLAAVEAQLTVSRKNTRLQRTLLGLVTAGLLMSTTLGLLAFREYRKAASQEIQALSRSSAAFFALNQPLDALIEAIRANRTLHRAGLGDRTLQTQTEQVLSQAVINANEQNRLSGHQAWVNGVAFSPDGAIIASASLDHTVNLWNRNGQLLSTLKGHFDGINRVAFSPDGLQLATTSYDNTAKLWSIRNVRSPQLLATLKGHQDTVWGVAFSPDGKTIATAGWDGTAKLWDLQGHLKRTVVGHQAQVSGVSFSPDGKTLATASWDRTIKLWSLDGKLLNTLSGHRDAVNDVVFSRDGSWLASASADTTVRIWGRDGTLRQRLRGHGARVWTVVLSPDQQTLASASEDNTLKLWHTDGRLLDTFRGHRAAVWGVAFSPDGQTLASASSDRTVKLWQRHNPFRTVLYGHRQRISAIAFSPDGQTFATAAADNTVKLWNRTGTLWATLTAHTAEVNHVAFSPDGKLLATASWDKTLRLWRIDPVQRTATLQHTLRGHTAAVASVAFSPKGSVLVSGSFDNTVKLWTLQGTLLKTLTGHQGEINAIAFSPDGQTFITASGDSTLKLWNPEGTLLKTIAHHHAKVVDVQFSPSDQQWASASWDGTAVLWNQEGKPLQTFPSEARSAAALAFSPKGQYLAIGGSDTDIKIWSLSGELVKSLKGHTNRINDIAFSPDAQQLASVSDDQTIILWNWAKVLHLDEESYACHWLGNYLKYNLTLNNIDRKLCQ